jgi:hypothetical protein
LLYAYIACRPKLALLSSPFAKFSAIPSEVHYQCLKDVAKYLRNTQEWAIHFWRSQEGGANVSTLESFPDLPAIGASPSQLIG